MSNIPYTSVVVNPESIDVLQFQDYIYLMAPALQGGQLLDDFGSPVIDKTGRALFVPKIIGNIEEFEREFGLAIAGSPASIYARWIFDQVSVPIICRRIIGNDLSSAITTLKNATNDEIFWIESKAKTQLANRIMIDIASSSSQELFFLQENATFIADTNILHIVKNYASTDHLILEGIYQPNNQSFRYILNGQDNKQEFYCFDFRPQYVATEQMTYVLVDNIAPDDLVANQVLYDHNTGSLHFGSAPIAGIYQLVIQGNTPNNEPVTLALSTDGQSRTYVINFAYNTVAFQNLLVNGFSSLNLATDHKLVRLVSNVSGNINISCTNGTITNTTKLTITATYNSDTTTEVFDNLISYGHLIQRINDIISGSKLIQAELWEIDAENEPISQIFNQSLQSIGFKVSVYLDGYAETYDNLRDVGELENAINYKSALIRGTVLQYCHMMQPKLNTIGLRLKHGSSGLTPSTLDYIEALGEAERNPYITLIVAPGIADSNFHALMKQHCHEMFKRGHYRTAVVGGELNETIETKKSRGYALSHERISIIGDGLELINPMTGERQLYAPSVVAAAFVGQIARELYHVSLTNKIMYLAKGLEHNYDDAQLQDLHNGRLVLFKNTRFGIQIVDGITTSPINAYEDIHMVRIFDALSRNVKRVMENSIGRSNTPPTWARIISIIRRMLNIMKDAHIIADFRLMTDVRPEDLVNKRYRFKIGIVPVFPIKYIEGFVDIFPPYAIETS